MCAAQGVELSTVCFFPSLYEKLRCLRPAVPGEDDEDEGLPTEHS